MKGLMELLGKSEETDSAPVSETTAEPMDEAAMGDSGATDSAALFDETASQAMEALKSGDSTAFADALRACIEMSA